MSTVKKSVATMPLAWARRNSVQVGPARRGAGRKPMASQDIGDAALGDRDAELLQLADDAQVAPAGVLPGQPDDQLDRLLRQGRASRSSVRVGPVPPDERPVPAQDRLGRDEERRPALPWHEPGQGGDECPVGPAEPGSCDLAAQDGQLVAEHQDLGVLGDGVHPVDAQELDDATDQAVEEAERHGAAGSLVRSCLVKPTIGLLDPSGLGRDPDLLTYLAVGPPFRQVGDDETVLLVPASNGFVCFYL